MKFEKLSIDGAYLVKLNPHADERGNFVRVFCNREFLKENIDFKIRQINRGFSKNIGTLRGMHLQMAPKEESKIFSCISGKVFDVILDLRPGSPSYKRWEGIELSENDNKLLFVPKGCAHGYQTLVDNSCVEYLVSEFYAPEFEKGIRWDDPAFGIVWPLGSPVISEKDRNWPLWEVAK